VYGVALFFIRKNFELVINSDKIPLNKTEIREVAWFN